MAETETRIPETRIKVFISYSRADKAFAADLVLGLAACGFAPYIDRQDIAAGEDWEKRLAGLITEADTVVYVISPDSLTSENCALELRQALAQQKRILPVMWRAVPDAQAPRELKRLNYIFFTGEGRTFAAGLSDLAAALRTDIDWIREHSRLAELARRWSARSRSDALLLRGDDIDAAQAWTAARPMGGAAVTDEQADFIKASADARALTERKMKAARGRLLAVVSLVAVAMAGLAGFAGLQWLSAEQAREKAVAAGTSLEEANRRLSAPLGLMTARNDAGQYVIGEQWYRVAAKFVGAAALVERSGGGVPGGPSMGTLIAGELLHPRFKGQFLLLAPRPFSRAPDGADQPVETGPERIRVSFPIIDAKVTLAGAEQIYRVPVHLGGVYPFDVWKLDGTPPLGVRAVGEADVDCHEFEATDEARPIGYFVTAPGVSQATGTPVTMVISEVNSTDPYSMHYAQPFGIPMSGGAPLFDLTSGGVLAMHYGSEPDPQRPGQRRGVGLSLRMVFDVLRSEMADAQAQLSPICDQIAAPP